MNLATQYLGLSLRSPFVIGASPFSEDLALARELEGAGAGAIVMRSLFEEQVDAEAARVRRHTEADQECSAEAASYFPRPAEYQLSPDRYLRQLEGLKRVLSMPVIASLNGTRPGGWTHYARRFEAAGADAIELNLYRVDVEGDRWERVTDGNARWAGASISRKRP